MPTRRAIHLGDGTVVEGVDEGTISRFHGIAYAAPPVGPLRWRAPVPTTPAVGGMVHDGTRSADPALQVPFGGPAIGTEDCLRLDVTVPSSVGDALRPVLVWVHGGGFTAGRPDEHHTRPDAFVRDGVVVVQVRYRLGVFGWLRLSSIDGDLGDGNLGVADVLAATRWIDEHIAAFGGDPGRVTLAGQSAGASIVAALLARPDLPAGVRGAILQSGPLDHVLRVDEADEVASRVARAAGRSSLGDLLSCGTEELLRAQQQVVAAGFDGCDPRRFLPFSVVGGTPTVGVDPVGDLARGPRGRSVVVGANLDEAVMFTPPGSEPDDLVSWAERAGIADPAAHVDGHRAVNRSDRDAFVAMRSDLLFRAPARRCADVLRSAGIPVWHYDFRWPSSAPGFGAAHTLELRVVFATTDDPEAAVTHGGIPHDLVDAVHGAWASFVAVGDPTPVDASWPSFLERGTSLVIDARIHVAAVGAGAEDRG